MKKTTQKSNIERKSIDEIVDEFKRLEPTYSLFVIKLKELLTELLEAQGIDFHALEYRVKSLESVKEKIQRPGKSYNDPLNELPDLAALRIIAYYQDDIARIRKLLKNEFSIDDQHSSNKSEELAPDQFGYLSVHEVIKLSDNRKKLTEWTKYKDLHAEVQIRSVLQHAWASISHKLQYKMEIDIPQLLRRKLMRLSGLLELADEQFSELRIERSELTKQISQDIRANNLEIDINNDSVSAYLMKASVVKRVSSSVSKAGLSLVKSFGVEVILQLTLVCRGLGIDSLAKLDNTLRNLETNFDAFFELFAKKHAVSDSTRGAIGGSIPHWTAVVLVGYDFGNFLKSSDIPWSFDYSKDIISAGRVVFSNIRK